MFCYWLRLCLVVLLINAISSAPKDKRTLEVFVNPECHEPYTPHDTTDFDVVHIKASSPHDTIHYIWSNIEIPTLIGVKTPLDANLCLNWTLLDKKENLSSAINFSDFSLPGNAIAMYITQLFEFVDTDDKANLEFNTSIPISWDNFKWDHVNLVENNSNSVSLEFHTNGTTNSSVILEGGSVTLKLQVYSQGGRLDQSPSLINTFNSTQLFVVLDRLRAHNPSSRFGFQIAMEYPHNQSIKLNEDQHMDDETSPGVFKVLSLKDPTIPHSGYVFWKPVAYLDPKHIITNSTDATYFSFKNVIADLKNVLTPFNSSAEQVPFDILLGMIDDGFYAKHNYTSWTAVMGFGQVPMEHTSLLAQLLFGIGMGIPLIIMIVASVYACKKRFSTSQDEPLLP